MDPSLVLENELLEEQKTQLLNLSAKLHKVQADKKALHELKKEGDPKSDMEEQLDMIESTLHRYIKRIQTFISETELKNLQSMNSKKPAR